MEISSCPICHLENIQIARFPDRDAYKVCCKRCGSFVTEWILLNDMPGKIDFSEEEKRLLPYLSAYTRQTTERGGKVEINLRGWQESARAHSATSVSQKIRKLMELIGTRSSYPGESVKIDATLDYPLLDASGSAECSYLLSSLRERGFIRSGDGNSLSQVIVTAPGWEFLEPSAGGNGIPGQCFVAMSFDQSLNEAYEVGIRAAVEQDCKLRAVRLDLEQHNEKICDKILAEIKLAQFIVADFTHHRGGVYFEAGFALGLGRPVIWTCRSDELKDAHFDTRQYNYIPWTTPQDLRQKLTDRIKATILR